MEKRDILAVILFAGVLFTGYLLFTDANITAYAVYTPELFNITFTQPTPDNNAVLTLSTAVINITASSDISTAWLEWNYANETIFGSQKNWYMTKTGSGNFTFRVYANDSYGNFTYTEQRIITLNFTSQEQPSLNLTQMPNITIAEDSVRNITFDLQQYTQSNKNITQINYTISSQQNISLASCEIKSNRYINCTPASNQSGNSLVSITANYSSSSSLSSFSIIITPVNDPPYATGIIPNITMSNKQNATIILSTYFRDVDNSTLVYNYSSSATINSTIITINITNGSAFMLPYPNITGIIPLNFTASDGTNTTFSNNLIINITGESTASITTLTLNITSPKISRIDAVTWQEGSEYTLDMSKYTSDIGDNPEYSFSGLSNIAYSIISTNAIFRAEKSWSGTETATLHVLSSKGEFSSEPFTLTVTKLNKLPEIKKSLPIIIFNETGQKISINLDDYFFDPDGEQLSYDISQSKLLNITRGAKNWITLMLAEGIPDIQNETITVSAKDNEGKEITDTLFVTISDSLKNNIDFSKIGWYIIVLALITIIICLIIKKSRRHSSPFGSVSSSRQYRPEPKERQEHQNGEKQIQKSSSTFLSFLARKKIISNNVKNELFAIKQVLAAVRTLKESAKDSLVKAALAKDEEKITKAMKGMMVVKDFKDMKKELLYLKEARASLKEVKESSEEKIINEELEDALKTLNDAVAELEIKIEASTTPVYNLPE